MTASLPTPTAVAGVPAGRLTRIDADAIRAIKQRYSLAPFVVASGVELHPIGRGRWMGRCPFHEDREPSFLVDSSDEHWHCFGACVGDPVTGRKAHGDVIDFVMRLERLTFVEACARLTGPAVHPAMATTTAATAATATPERYLVQLAQPRRLASTTHPEPCRWERLSFEEQLVMQTAAAIYRRALWRAPRVLAYLFQRGIPAWVIHACGLGYADGHSLEAHLRRRSGLRIAESLGLLRRTSGPDATSRPLREFFAGRIVVPELRGGRCIWFIGRALDGRGVRRQARAKYLSLEGEQPLLGLERAAGRRTVFLCEGVFDWLTAIAWGLPAVSACGTHLPISRLSLLDRTRTFYGIFDGDVAGHTAAVRLHEELGNRFRRITLPDGCDLNDLGRRSGGRRTFFQLLAAARSGVDRL